MADETFAEKKLRWKRGRKGKSSEALVEELLNKWRLGNVDFDFDRLPDTRAAGRPMPARVSDFTLFYKGVAYSLEVKELEQASRLAKFVQLPRMQRRALAGCPGYVLIHLLERKTWVLANVSYFLNNPALSWELSALEHYTNPGEAMRTFLPGIMK